MPACVERRRGSGAIRRGVGAQPPHKETVRGGWVGSRAQRVLVRRTRGLRASSGAPSPGCMSMHRDPVPRGALDARAGPAPIRRGVGAQPPHQETVRGGWVGSRAQRVLVRRTRGLRASSRAPSPGCMSMHGDPAPRGALDARARPAPIRRGVGAQPPYQETVRAGGWGAARSACSSDAREGSGPRPGRPRPDACRCTAIRCTGAHSMPARARRRSGGVWGRSPHIRKQSGVGGWGAARSACSSDAREDTQAARASERREKGPGEGVDEQRFCQCKRAATLSVPPSPSEDAAAPFRRPGTPLART